MLTDVVKFLAWCHAGPTVRGGDNVTRAEDKAAVPRPTSKVLRGMGLSSLSRLVVLPVTALAGAATTFLIIGYAGASVFGYVALIGLLFQLIPFADLGLGAAIVNAVSSEENAVRVTQKAIRVLLASAVVIAAVAVPLSAFNTWPTLLGIPGDLSGSVDVAVLLSLIPFAMSLPFGVGQRILLGLHKNHVMNLIAVAGPVVGVAYTALLVAFKADPMLLAAATPVGVMFVSIISFVVAIRYARWDLLKFVRGIFSKARDGRPVALWNAAVPMFVISVSVPLAMQSGRLVLSHFGSSEDLAQYSVGAQFYTPTLSLIVTGTVTLWPVFARDRANSRGLWIRVTLLLGGIGLLFGGIFALLIGPVSSVVSSSTAVVGLPLAVAFGLLIFVMALQQPSGALLTSPRLLMFQAVCSVLMVAASLALAIWLSGIIGAPGVVIAAAAAVLVCQTIPGMLRSLALFRFGDARA